MQNFPLFDFGTEWDPDTFWPVCKYRK